MNFSQVMNTHYLRMQIICLLQKALKSLWKTTLTIGQKTVNGICPRKAAYNIGIAASGAGRKNNQQECITTIVKTVHGCSILKMVSWIRKLHTRIARRKNSLTSSQGRFCAKNGFF